MLRPLAQLLHHATCHNTFPAMLLDKFFKSNAYNLCFLACRPTSSIIRYHPFFSVFLVWCRKIFRIKYTDDHFGKPTHRLNCSIFTNANVLISIVSRNAVCNYPHSCRDFLICTKSLQAHGISSLSKIPTIGLANLNNFHKQGSSHSVPSPEEVWRICWILRKVVLHQHLVLEMAISRNAKTADGRSSPPLSVLIFVLLDGKAITRLLAVVEKQRLTIRVIRIG